MTVDDREYVAELERENNNLKFQVVNLEMRMSYFKSEYSEMKKQCDKWQKEYYAMLQELNRRRG